MIMCECCRPKGIGNYRTKQVDEKYDSMDDVDFRSSFEKLKLGPSTYAGSEVTRITRAIMQSEVEFITINGGAALNDIGEKLIVWVPYISDCFRVLRQRLTLPSSIDM